MRDLEAPPAQILTAWLPTLLTPTAPREVVDLLAEMMRDSHTAGVRVALNALGPADLRHVLGTIAVPTLVLYGDADQRSRSASDRSCRHGSPDPPWSSFPVHRTWRTWNSLRRSTQAVRPFAVMRAAMIARGRRSYGDCDVHVSALFLTGTQTGEAAHSRPDAPTGFL